MPDAVALTFAARSQAGLKTLLGVLSVDIRGGAASNACPLRVALSIGDTAQSEPIPAGFEFCTDFARLGFVSATEVLCIGSGCFVAVCLFAIVFVVGTSSPALLSLVDIVLVAETEASSVKAAEMATLHSSACSTCGAVPVHAYRSPP